MNIKFNITDEIVSNSREGCPRSCLIANTIKPALKDGLQWAQTYLLGQIENYRFLEEFGGNFVAHTNDNELLREIAKNYDSGKEFAREFELDIPSKFIRNEYLVMPELELDKSEAMV